jgi:hypothetical protein
MILSNVLIKNCAMKLVILTGLEIQSFKHPIKMNAETRKLRVYLKTKVKS